MEYRIFISIVDISANLENIDIDKAILKISISIRLFWKISISIGLFWKISISIRRFWKISISIRRFRKISISIKYRIDKNLAYRTGQPLMGLYNYADFSVFLDVKLMTFCNATLGLDKKLYPWWSKRKKAIYKQTG